MKKLVLICMNLFLLLVFISSFKPLTIDQKLKPYQEAVDRINQEFNATITIPEDTKTEVYNNIKSMTPRVFESDLRHQYRTTGKGLSRINRPKLYNREYEQIISYANQTQE